MIPMHSPIRIDGVEIVLIDDLVISHLTQNLESHLMPIESLDDELPLYVERRQIDALSEMHPGLPIYGLWQVFIASERVPQEAGLYQSCTDLEPHPTRYLMRESDGAYSGRLTGDTLLDLSSPHSKNSEPVALSEEIESLRLPEQPIQTLQQQHNQRLQVRHRNLMLMGFMLLTSIFAGFAADRILHHQHTQQLQLATLLKEQNQALQNSLRQLNAQGRIEVIDQSRRLQQLMILAHHAQPIELPPTSLLADEQMNAIIRAPSPVVPLGLPVHTHTIQPDASLHISW